MPGHQRTTNSKAAKITTFLLGVQKRESKDNFQLIMAVLVLQKRNTNATVKKQMGRTLPPSICRHDWDMPSPLHANPANCNRLVGFCF